MLPALKPLRRPRLWLGLWCAAIAMVIVASLLPAIDLPQVPPGSDKLEHVLAYALLAAAAVQLFATRRALATSAIALALLGVAIEVVQGMLTATRSMEAADAAADAIGIALGMATLWTPWRDLLLRLDRRGA